VSSIVRAGRQRGMDYRKIITVNPKVRKGQPCVRGMPITVREILEVLASGKTVDEVLASYVKLTREDIRACLAFSAEGG
jgi:uncharacterized protein (DUF433 family)